jgi:hypothetical protein
MEKIMAQINLFTPLWKESLKYLGWVLLLIVLTVKGCSNSDVEPQIVKVEIPEVKGDFESKKPTHEPIVNPSNSTPLKKGETIYKENPIDKKLIAENEKLKTDYALASDSVKQLKFDKAIQLNKFSTDFEDENLILNINGIVQGEVKEITPNYTIKKKTIEVAVKQKETVFRVLAGGAVGINKELNQAVYSLDLNFQNKKGNIISAEYLNLGGQSFGMVGYKKSIINIKK